MKILPTKHFTQTFAVQPNDNLKNKVLRVLDELSSQEPLEILMSHKTTKLISRDQKIYSYRIDNRLRLVFSIFDNDDGEPSLILLSLMSHQ